MSITEAIVNNMGGCVVDRCRQRNKCSVSLSRIQPSQRAIVDCDKYIDQYGYSQKLCDYIVGCELSDAHIAAIEMKSGGVRAGEVVGQIGNGAALANTWLDDAPVKKFLPLLLHKGINPSEFRVLKKLRVSFRGKNYPISTAKCGASLRDLLEAS